MPIPAPFASCIPSQQLRTELTDRSVGHEVTGWTLSGIKVLLSPPPPGNRESEGGWGEGDNISLMAGKIVQRCRNFAADHVSKAISFPTLPPGQSWQVTHLGPWGSLPLGPARGRGQGSLHRPRTGPISSRAGLSPGNSHHPARANGWRPPWTSTRPGAWSAPRSL